MFCSHCGRRVGGREKLCPGCGAPVLQTAEHTFYAAEENSGHGWQREEMRSCGGPVTTCDQMQHHPMKWFHFLIHFGLFAEAFLALVNGAAMATGVIYGTDSELLYICIPNLRILDQCIGILSVASAAGCIYVRFLLTRYREKGPKWLMGLYLFNLGINLIYIVGAVVLFDQIGVSIAPDALSQEITAILSSVIMIGVNKAYFRKRAELFVN